MQSTQQGKLQVTLCRVWENCYELYLRWRACATPDSRVIPKCNVQYPALLVPSRVAGVQQVMSWRVPQVNALSVVYTNMFHSTEHS